MCRTPLLAEGMAVSMFQGQRAEEITVQEYTWRC